jgi:hypothetical protein
MNDVPGPVVILLVVVGFLIGFRPRDFLSDENCSRSLFAGEPAPSPEVFLTKAIRCSL